MDLAGILATKNFLYIVGLVAMVGIWKVARDVVKGRPVRIFEGLLSFTSSALGGMLFLLIALGAGLNIFWCGVAAMIGAWLGVSAFRVGEAEVRKMAGLDRRKQD